MQKNILINEIHLEKLCCPKTRESLIQSDESLVSIKSKISYPISESGIPQFALHNLPEESLLQKNHYNRIANQYIKNLSYPHTIEYLNYLNDEFRTIVNFDNSLTALELCCGTGELLSLYTNTKISGIGLDISLKMLESAKLKSLDNNEFFYVQGDATNIPIPDSSVDYVFIFGGIHHIPNRKLLFSEIYRILKPNGFFYFREPVSDFFLWRILRYIIYRISPSLDEKTERPLLWSETVPVLNETGFKLESWTTHGFIGFCLLMNSDILIFNRLFRYIPGIRLITKLAARFDKLILKIPGLKFCGLQVIGSASKIN